MLECLRRSVRQADVPFHVSEVKMVDNQKWWHSQITCFHPTSNRRYLSLRHPPSLFLVYIETQHTTPRTTSPFFPEECGRRESKMTEPRQRPRAKGQPIFNQNDLNELLYAFGDSAQPLSTTVTTLDEILADFIIETCHAAALCASYSRRQKIKIDDFRWVLRKNPALLGRVNEQLFREKYIKNQRRLVDFDAYGKEGAAELADIAAAGGADESDLKAGKKGRGRKKKRKAEDEGGAGGSKKAKGI